MPPTTRRLLDDLSPESRLDRIRAPVFLVHGRQDPAAPFTESPRRAEAARAAGRPVGGTIVGAVGQVDPEERAGWLDLLRLWATLYSFRVTAG